MRMGKYCDKTPRPPVFGDLLQDLGQIHEKFKLLVGQEGCRNSQFIWRLCTTATCGEDMECALTTSDTFRLAKAFISATCTLEMCRNQSSNLDMVLSGLKSIDKKMHIYMYVFCKSRHLRDFDTVYNGEFAIFIEKLRSTLEFLRITYYLQGFLKKRNDTVLSQMLSRFLYSYDFRHFYNGFIVLVRSEQRFLNVYNCLKNVNF